VINAGKTILDVIVRIQEKQSVFRGQLVPGAGVEPTLAVK
jgi:hypothetical protein